MDYPVHVYLCKYRLDEKEKDTDLVDRPIYYRNIYYPIINHFITTFDAYIYFEQSTPQYISAIKSPKNNYKTMHHAIEAQSL